MPHLKINKGLSNKNWYEVLHEEEESGEGKTRSLSSKTQPCQKEGNTAKRKAKEEIPDKEVTTQIDEHANMENDSQREDTSNEEQVLR